MAVGGKQGTVEKVDEYTVALQVRGALLHASRTRSPRSASPATSTEWLARDGAVRAQALHAAVPPQVRRPRPKSSARPRTAKFDNWVTLLQEPQRPAAQRRAARRLAPWQTTTPINTPDRGHGAQPVLLRRRHRRQPAAVHRQDHLRTLAENLEVLNLRAIAGEYDVPGAPHRHRQGAGLQGERAEGQLHRQASGSGSTAPTPASSSTRTTRPTRRSPSG